MADARQAQLRAALAATFDEVSGQMIERVVTEATRALSIFGLSGDAPARYGAQIQATLPVALDALTEAEPVTRERKLRALAADVRRVSETHHIPRLIESGLVRIAFTVAQALVRQHGGRSGFSMDELDFELVGFRESFERALFELEQDPRSNSSAP